MSIRIGRDRADCTGGHRRRGSHKGIKGTRGRDSTIAITRKRCLYVVISIVNTGTTHVRKAKVRIEACAAVVGTMVLGERIEVLGQDIQARHGHVGKARIHIDKAIPDNNKGR
jgi:hypothetical protein